MGSKMRNINHLKQEKATFGINDIIKDAIIALAVCGILYLCTHQAFIFVLSIPFSIAAIIGDIVRKYSRPNAVSTKGNAWKVLDNKIYWSIGPQIEAIILSIFFFYIFVQMIGATSSTENQKNVISDASESVSYRD